MEKIKHLQSIDVMLIVMAINLIALVPALHVFKAYGHNQDALVVGGIATVLAAAVSFQGRLLVFYRRVRQSVLFDTIATALCVLSILLFVGSSLI
ncbi:hypothetical protein [Vibrio mediterranei]|uniref:hypothetical protein n=1 Tax=Vibrio mediterranei TaxID=689 RepID=UPI0040693562